MEMSKPVSKRKIEAFLVELLKKEIGAVKGLSLVIKDVLGVVNILSQISGKLVVTGMGKSGHVGAKVAATMTSLGIPAVFMHAAEAFHGDVGIIGKGDALVAISNSGNTKGLVQLARHLGQEEVPIIAIVGNPKSELAKNSSAALVYSVQDEGSPFNLAPMASATASLVIGDLLASALSLKKGFSPKTFADLHPGGSLGLQLTKVSEQMVSGRNVPLVENRESLKRVLLMMSKKRPMGIVGVINKKKKLSGVITDGDIRRFLLRGGKSDSAFADNVMTRTPKVIGPDASLQEAIEMMENHKITSLFVVNASNNPIGMIHMHQILERQFNF